MTTRTAPVGWTELLDMTTRTAPVGWTELLDMILGLYLWAGQSFWI